jgi:hypothetical protein
MIIIMMIMMMYGRHHDDGYTFETEGLARAGIR